MMEFGSWQRVLCLSRSMPTLDCHAGLRKRITGDGIGGEHDHRDERLL